MIRVKICGITRADDANLAVTLGADALGFIQWAPSKRAITPDAARAIITALPPFVTPVGVFVNQDAATIEALRRYCGFRAVQLHGDESPSILDDLTGPVIKAFRAIPNDAELSAWRVSAVLADGALADHYGGTGTLADDRLIAALGASGRLILAGGLTPESVGARCRVVRPYAVDVASGVEASPGRKDSEKLRAFIEAVRATEKNEQD